MFWIAELHLLCDIQLIARGFDANSLQHRLPHIGVVELAMSPVSIECEPKVRNLEMSRGADKKVVRLDIAMDPLHVVCFLDAQDHLRNVLLGMRLFQYIFTQEQTEEVAADHVLHHEVQVCIVLKACNERHNPARALRSHQEISFGSQVTFLSGAKHVGLANHLHGKDI